MQICRVFLDANFENKEELISLAFSLEENVSLETEQDLSDVSGPEEAEDQSIGNMTNLRDFPRILKKQFLFPDRIFYHRLVRNELFVMKPERRQKQMTWDQHLEEQSRLNSEKAHLRKRSYVLMDVSASTKRAHRLLIEKAIAIAFLENHRQEGGEVWFRTFNHSCGRLWLTKDEGSYRNLVNQGIVAASPIGQTNLQKAISTAMDDLDTQPSEDRAEILLLTDGLAPLNLEELDSHLSQHTVHVVLIGGDAPELSESELRDHFMSSQKNLKDQMDNSLEKELRDQARAKLEQIYAKRRPTIQKDLSSRWKEDLKACAVNSGGIFLHIPDLPQSSFSIDEQLADLEDRLYKLEARLKDPSSTTLEKEEILEELLTIQAYAEELKGHTSSEHSSKSLPDISKMAAGSEELMTMLEHAQIRWEASHGNHGEDVDLLFIVKAIRETLRRWFGTRK